MIPPRLVIRCDGGTVPEIGTGHVVRMLTLVKMLVAGDIVKREEIVFVMKKEAPYQIGRHLVSAEDFAILKYSSSALFANSVSEASMLCSIGPSVAIIDRLETEARFVERLHCAGMRVVTFEDTGSGSSVADLVVNAIFGQGPSSDNTLNGYRYLILSGKFREKTPNTRKRLRVTISFGGFDARNLCDFVLCSLCERHLSLPVEIVLIVGDRPGRQINDIHKQARDLTCNSGAKIQILHRVDNFPQQVADTDLAIISGGLTLFEFAAHGVATVALPQYEHQLDTLKRFSQLGGTRLISENMHLDQAELAESFYELVYNEKLRTKIGMRAKMLVDGKGGDRLIKRVSDLIYGAAST